MLNRIICVNYSLRFTSGVKPLDLLAASMAAESISFMYWKQVLVGLETEKLFEIVLKWFCPRIFYCNSYSLHKKMTIVDAIEIAVVELSVGVYKR